MTEKRKSPEEWFHIRATHYVEAQVLYHLNRCGVFQALTTPKTASDLARELGLDERVLSVLLDYVYEVDTLLERSPVGAYALSDFGRDVCARYGREAGGRTTYNFFDVRVGAYGPVWAGLGALLRREAEYGKDLARMGEPARDALATSAARFYPALKRAVEKTGAGRVVELGASTVPAELLRRDFPSSEYCAVDRSAESLRRAEELAGSAGLRPIQADLFSVGWARLAAPPDRATLFFSVHFHEILAAGETELIGALRTLRAEAPGSRLLLLEEPRPAASSRGSATPHEWLYAQSNVLIHHLIGNGKILTSAEWEELFTRAGLSLLERWRTGYLGYEAQLFSV